jgi:hypothetical protein
VSALDPVSWLRAAWAAVGDSLHGQITGLLTSTSGPLSLAGLTASPTVAHYATLTRLVADGALAAVLVWAFLALIWQPSAQGQYRLRVLLPRLLLASLLINFSGPLLQGAIDLNRALAQTVVQAGGLQLGTFFGDVTGGLAVTQAPPSVAVAAAMFVSLLLLLAVYVLRYALVTVLVVTAPLAALLLVLPGTAEHARQWSGLFVATLFMQPLQLLILGIGWNLDAHDLGLGPLRHALALACIVLCFRVPGLLRSGSLARGGGYAGGRALLTPAWTRALGAAA